MKHDLKSKQALRYTATNKAIMNKGILAYLCAIILEQPCSYGGATLAQITVNCSNSTDLC